VERCVTRGVLFWVVSIDTDPRAVCIEDSRRLGMLGIQTHLDRSSDIKLDQLGWSGQEEEDRDRMWEIQDMMGVTDRSAQGSILSRISGAVVNV